MKKLTLLAALVGITILSSSFAPSPVPPAKKLLAFPVAGKKSNIGSFWGASRDGGRRKHQGIDIFAKKGTAVVAITDGVIIESGDTPIGGKVLWLKSATHGWTAYYAHLDKKAVKEGQYVRKGQVLGTVGNTGNARYTPAHLHFGIYKSSGPINPLPYVKNAPKVLLKQAPVKRKVSSAKKAVRKRRA
ncbi:M23 family metallopeptidase [Flavisolibacter sp. BT320]|nr:M23 family metallopeptidase [Flavisolibacter longurius]